MAKIFNVFPRKRARMEQDLERELRYHLDRRAQDLVDAGLSEKEARRRAAVEFGGLAQVQEEVRETWLWQWIQDLANGMSDLRFAIRMMTKRPGPTLLAITVLALGIALTSTMFSIINGALLRSLPFPESDRIQYVAAVEIAKHHEVKTRIHTYSIFTRRQQSFEQLAASSFFTALVAGPDGIPERYSAVWVTANMFRLLRVEPILGPGFRDENGQP